MILIYNIKEKDLNKAKEETKVFDLQKTYNKFVCNHNYIGLLGEMVLDQHLKDKDINHTWVQFTKKGWSEPDFIINMIFIFTLNLPEITNTSVYMVI